MCLRRGFNHHRHKVVPVSSCGFTLVELLSVIAVISILAALLMPALARAKDKAYRASCISNLKQLAYAFQMYMQDYDERIPHEDDGSGGEDPKNSCWFDLLDKYLDGKNLSKVKQCGGFKGKDTYHSIKMNSLLESDERDVRFRNMATIRHPDRTILVFDGRVDNPSVAVQTKGMYASGASPGSVAGRHDNGANLLFCDFHVEWFLKKEIDRWGDNGSSPIIWDPESR
jgi:prepilin-type N-terminal cleavage/methylation domain-containing protein/prepilin-type processing-associated H-X9-DG protein